MNARRFLSLSLLSLASVASPSMAADSDAPAADSAAAAAAAAPTPDWTFPGSVDIASDYIFRGLTQTNKRPAL